MGKKLKTVIAIIALGFIIYLFVPFILKNLVFDNSGITNYQMQWVTILSLFISVILILFGIGRMTGYAATAGDETKKKVKTLLYTGLFLWILPYILPYIFMLIDIVFPVSYHLVPIHVFIIKTMVHVAGALILIIWGIKTAWDNKEEMEDRPVFDAFKNYFSSLNKWGWALYIFIALLVAGYVYILVDGMPEEKNRNSVVTIIGPGNLSGDPAINQKAPTTAESNDTVLKIHRINETRMLVTMADGSYRWHEIPFIKSSQGWNGYLFKSIHTNDLKVSPDRNSRAIPEADGEGYRRRYQKNTNIRILEVYNDPEAFERNQTARSYAMWAKVSVRDSRAKADVVGWLPYSQVRIHGQMRNNVNYWIWTPLKWINNELGDGFFAGLVNIILILIFIPTTAFLATRLISIKMRFLPNIVLVLMLILVAIGLLYKFYYSFFDPSAFNWNNWSNETAHLLYLGIIGAGGLVALKQIIQQIYEERCPDCKYWEGYAYNRKLLFRDVNKYKLWNETHYTDGTTKISGERYETHTDEKWKDSCKCARCGNRWTLQRHIHKVD